MNKSSIYIAILFSLTIFSCSEPRDIDESEFDGCYKSSSASSFYLSDGFFFYRSEGELKKSRIEASRDNYGAYIVTYDPVVLFKSGNKIEFSLQEYSMKMRPDGRKIYATFPKSGDKVIFMRHKPPCDV